MIITSKQIEELKPYIDGLDAIVESGNVQNLLDAIDNLIVDNALGNDGEPDDVGIKLQKIYDEIYEQN